MSFSDLSITRKHSLGEENGSADHLAYRNSHAMSGIDNLEFSDIAKKDDANADVTPSYQNAADVTVPMETVVPKWRIWKNLLVICIAFLFNFTAFQSLQNLQSSLNYSEGLGVASLSVIYASLIVSCIFVPPILIGKIGCKWTLVVSIFWYSVFTAGNFYASWYTLMPMSVTLGLAAAPLWTAKSKYVTTSGIRYAGMVGETQEDVITMFFGIFFMVFQSGQIWGNLISSLVLERRNVTKDYIPSKLYVISLYFNPTRIYLGCGLFAVLVLAVFLDKLKSEGEEKKPGLELLIATLKHLKDDRRQVLLVPITIYSGLEQAYVSGDYTKSFVSCALGIEWIGYVMICYGVCDAFFSFLLGRLIKFTGRLPLFITGAVAHLAMIITMLVWSPNPNQLPVFFVLAACWGLGDAVWQLEINALYGYLFRKNQEAGFSNYRLWESLGFVVAFAYSNFICTNVKLYILLGVLVLGMMGYAVVEYNEKQDPEEADTKM
ncbi:protein unc-93 homolog A-like [Branchiostoma floridae]|uniref:Protein unc-93 homolog A n=1 Tax=Branchiostoma floridae TaxID=7739 RepID=A0A9J7LPT0_BRAFL|nr:protein unc-93 homolog A-like [Branchiostoma floridae]